MDVEEAMKLSTRIALGHPTHPATVPCASCAVLVLADAVQDMRLALKRLRKQHDICLCGLQKVDGICGNCGG